jgi:hypothetical protein
MSTRLHRFLEQHGVATENVASAAGLTPAAVADLRLDDGDPTLAEMRAIRDACRELTGLPVTVSELFDFGDD